MKKAKAILVMSGMIATGFGIGRAISRKSSIKDIESEKQKVNKFKSYYNLLNKWLAYKQEGNSIAKYFYEHNYKTIAIYGLGEIGCRLYEDLKNTDIVVKYAIDRNFGSQCINIPVFSPDDKLDDVDAVIVTAIFDFISIEEELVELLDCPIISLEDVMAEL